MEEEEEKEAQEAEEEEQFICLICMYNRRYVIICMLMTTATMCAETHGLHVFWSLQKNGIEQVR